MPVRPPPERRERQRSPSPPPMRRSYYDLESFCALDVAQRVSRHLSQELVKLTRHHAGKSRDDLGIKIHKPLEFTIDDKDPIIKEKSTEPAPGQEEAQTRHFVSVMLLSGYDPSSTDSRDHPSKRVQFLVVEQVSADIIYSMGGEWVKGTDGDEPTDDNLQKCAQRHCQLMCGLDLTACTKWMKFVEFEYKRSDGTIAHSVVFLPNVWDHYETLSAKMRMRVKEKVVKEEKEVDGEDGKKVKETVESVVPENKLDVRPVVMSLQDLRALPLKSRAEQVIELRLFASTFDEMLQRDFGNDVVTLLQQKANDVAELKRQRAEEAAEIKRKRSLETVEEGNATKKQKLEGGKVKVISEVDQSKVTPFEYFDQRRVMTSSVRCDAIENMMYSLGSMTTREITALLEGTGLTVGGKPASYHYLSAATSKKEIPVEEPPATPSEPAKKEEEKKETNDETKVVEEDKVEKEEPAETTAETAAPAETEAAPAAMDEDGKKETPSETFSRKELESMLVVKLKETCKARGLPITGNKAEIVTRLLDAQG